MLERLLDFLKNLPGAGGTQPDQADDPRVAATALLFHVMDADGVREEGEMKRLRALLSETYGISGRELEGVVAAGEEAGRDAVDLYAFTRVLNRHLDVEARSEFVALMWEMVFADGELHELEDNVVWRVAELIGVERQERVALRRRARARAAATGRESG